MVNIAFCKEKRKENNNLKTFKMEKWKIEKSFCSFVICFVNILTCKFINDLPLLVVIVSNIFQSKVKF